MNGNPFAKDNEFGTPFHLVQAEEEDTHLQGVMANLQAYIDHPDTEPRAKVELTHTLETLRLARRFLTEAQSACPRR